jgi:hypothetical protein
VTIRFYYRFDTSGFFGASDRRAVLELAAADVTTGMRDYLAGVLIDELADTPEEVLRRCRAAEALAAIGSAAHDATPALCAHS